MRERMRELLIVCALAAAGSSCSVNHTPKVGGETHWLAACAADEECSGSDLSCVCGTCTRACSGDAACTGGAEAACFDRNSPLLLQRCEDRGSDSSRGLCLPRCTSNSDCGRGRACVQRTCVPAQLADAGAASLGARADASIASASADAGVHTSDFSGMSDSVDWSAPVTVPAPQVTIAGADERILGTWNQVNCDPTQPSGEAPWGCFSLSIARADSGEATGSLIVHRPAHNPYVSPLPLNGPFAPPTNPDVGYPVEIDPAHYSELSANIAGEVAYRMLDGHFDGTTLAFAFAPQDLWHDWCQLQKPYPWEVAGRSFFFCVPQDEAAQAGIDKGKIALCTSADFQPLCSNASPPGPGGMIPCTCVDAIERGVQDAYALCSEAFCHCDSGACDADLHNGEQLIRLTLADGRLSGTWVLDVLSRFSITLERVNP